MTGMSVIVSGCECESTNGLVGSRLGVPEAQTLQSRNRLNSLRMVDNLFEADRHMKTFWDIYWIFLGYFRDMFLIFVYMIFVFFIFVG